MLGKRGRDAAVWWVKGCKKERDFTEDVRDACKILVLGRKRGMLMGKESESERGGGKRGVQYDKSCLMIRMREEG